MTTETEPTTAELYAQMTTLARETTAQLANTIALIDAKARLDLNDERLDGLEQRYGATEPVELPAVERVSFRRDSYFTGLWVGAACAIGAVIAALGFIEAFQ